MIAVAGSNCQSWRTIPQIRDPHQQGRSAATTMDGDDIVIVWHGGTQEQSRCRREIRDRARGGACGAAESPTCVTPTGAKHCHTLTT
jgi:hypothetical protein